MQVFSDAVHVQAVAKVEGRRQRNERKERQ
jgi:hypothetical protein